MTGVQTCALPISICGILGVFLNGAVYLGAMIQFDVAQKLETSFLNANLLARRVYTEGSDGKLEVITSEEEQRIHQEKRRAGQSVEGKIKICKDNSFGIKKDLFCGYIPGRLSMTRFRRQPLRLAYRGTPRYVDFYYRRGGVQGSIVGITESGKYRFAAPKPQKPGQLEHKNKRREAWEIFRIKVDERKALRADETPKHLKHPAVTDFIRRYTDVETQLNAREERERFAEERKKWARKNIQAEKRKKSRIKPRGIGTVRLLFRGKSYPIRNIMGEEPQ